MEKQAFQLLQDQHHETLQRFDKLEGLLAAHTEDDSKVHKTVTRHATYWSILFLGLPTLAAFVGKKTGFSLE